MPEHENKDLSNPVNNMPDRRITGETDGHSVFRITFEDGCFYIGFTAGLIVDRVADIYWRRFRYSAHLRSTLTT